MRLAIFILALTATCAFSIPTTHNENAHREKIHHDVWNVVKFINNPIHHPEHLKIAQTFSLEAHKQHYKNDAYENFLHHFSHGYLKKGEVFTIFNEEHVKQAKALFELLYHANTYEVFHQTALWARHRFNEALFLYSYSVALVHRPDTHSVQLPPIYELYPHYFFPSEVIHKAYQWKMSTTHHHAQKEEHHFVIHSNYTDHPLSYYLEDVGINAFYFYYNIYYPSWMSSEEYHFANHNRGEIHHHVHKQLFARYFLENYSHGVEEVGHETEFHPCVTYPNGKSFPERAHFVNFKQFLNHYTEQCCNTYEVRIKDAIDLGYVHDPEGVKHHLYTEEGLNILMNMIEGNADSPNHKFYGNFLTVARHLFGGAAHHHDYHKLVPSALEHHSTSLRDPAFYYIYTKVFDLVNHYKENLPRYHKKHLEHHGINVEHVEFEPLVTFYDHFYSDIANGLWVTPEEYVADDLKVNVHQYRLNHKNFSYHVHVNVEKSTPVVVKVFLAPEHDEAGHHLGLSQVLDKVFLIDHFVHDVHVGKNVFTRNTADFHGFVEDEHEQLIHEVHDGHHYGFPLRYKLPRGSVDGKSFQVYVIVYPYAPYQHHDEHQEFKDRFHIDNFPLDYPFDRPVEYEHVYYVPNAYVKHVKIYHDVKKHQHQTHHFQHPEEHHEGSKVAHMVPLKVARKVYESTEKHVPHHETAFHQHEHHEEVPQYQHHDDVTPTQHGEEDVHYHQYHQKVPHYYQQHEEIVTPNKHRLEVPQYHQHGEEAYQHQPTYYNRHEEATTKHVKVVPHYYRHEEVSPSQHREEVAHEEGSAYQENSRVEYENHHDVPTTYKFERKVHGANQDEEYQHARFAYHKY